MKKIECQETKLILALAQVENLVNILEDNEYKSFLYNHLIPVKYELQRQLANLTNKTIYPTLEE
jgi:hypothetical protein